MFTRQGVVVSPGLSPVSHTARSLHLQFFSAQPTQVRVQGWRFAPVGASTEAAHAGEVGQVVPVQTRSKKAASYTSYVTLEPIPIERLEALFANGPCRLTVTLGGADPTADTTQMEFELTRVVEHKTGMLK